MNCYNHPTEISVAICPDCGKGLCRECASDYSPPICKRCAHKRVNAERNAIIKEMLLTFSFGGILAYFIYPEMGNHSDPVFESIFLTYIFAGIIPGWNTLTWLTPRVFLSMPILGWIFYFIIKLFLSFWLGLFMLPVRTIKNIIRLIALKRLK